MKQIYINMIMREVQLRAKQAYEKESQSDSWTRDSDSWTKVYQTLICLENSPKFFNKSQGLIVKGEHASIVRTFLYNITRILAVLRSGVNSNFPEINDPQFESTLCEMRDKLGLIGSLCASEGKDDVSWQDMSNFLKGPDCVAQESSAEGTPVSQSGPGLVQSGLVGDMPKAAAADDRGGSGAGILSKSELSTSQEGMGENIQCENTMGPTPLSTFSKVNEINHKLWWRELSETQKTGFNTPMESMFQSGLTGGVHTLDRKLEAQNEQLRVQNEQLWVQNLQLKEQLRRAIEAHVNLQDRSPLVQSGLFDDSQKTAAAGDDKLRRIEAELEHIKNLVQSDFTQI